jgi:beta-galactosidase
MRHQIDGELTRREAIQGSAVALGALALDAGVDADAASARGRKEAAVPAGRHEMSFDEGWLFLLGDPSGAQAPSFEDSSWRKLDVPHDWRIEDLAYAPADADGGATSNPSAMAFVTNPSPDGSPPAVIGPFDSNTNSQPGPSGNQHGQGSTVSAVGWYRKHFTVPAVVRDEHEARRDGDEQRVEVRFEGVYQNADFWLNGHHLGFHPNGYTSFAFDLTPYLNRSGRNVLAVRVNCDGVTSRWYSGSGIYRHAYLTLTGPVRIPLWGVYVKTPVVSESRSVVHAQVRVASFGGRTPGKVRVTVLDSRGRKVGSRTTAAKRVSPGHAATFATDIAVRNASLWSPESPTLYTARAEVLVAGKVVDTLDTAFGIRSLVWNSQVGFELNGKQIKINGGCIHHDHGPLGAIALNRSEERKIETLKAAGFNAIRSSHNPRSPYMLDVCDRLGMLVWDEFSDMWDVSKTADDYSKYFPQYWQQDLSSMILRDRNHPSVIIWSLGNEISSDPNGYGPRMYALVKSLDKTRPISVGGTTASYADVDDVHYGNSSSQLSGMPASDSVDSTHSSYPTHAVTQSESFPATVYDDWKLMQDNPWFVGSWVWAAWDYIGEAGCGATPFGPTYNVAAAYALAAVAGAVGYPWFQDFQGDFDLIGQRKPQNYWRSVVYGQSPIEMLVERPPPPGTSQYAALWGYYDELESWTWDVLPTQSMTVHVYTSGDSVKLLLNGTEVATNPVAESDGRLTTFSLSYAPGDLTAIASRNGAEIGRKTLTTTGAPAALRVSSDVSSLTTSRDDLAHVLVEVVDAQGRRVPDAVVKVAFAVSGAGELAGVANGNPHNVDSFKQPRRYTWHGQALAVLRPAKTAGTLTLTVSAQGLQPTRVTLPVKSVGAPSHPHKKRKRRHTVRAASLSSLGAGPALIMALGAAVLRRRIERAAPGP